MENKEPDSKIEEKTRIEDFPRDKEGFVDFGHVSQGVLDQQSQYASRYIHGFPGGYPNFGEGLRFLGDPLTDYHRLKIHKDDIAEFVRRMRDYAKRFEETE